MDWPMKLTAQLSEQIITFVKGGGSPDSAAAVLNISRDTLTSWLQSDPDFAQRIDAAIASARLVAELDLHQKRPAAWLKRRRTFVPRRSPAAIAKPGKHKIKGLTLKQARFVREYVADCNASQAAIRAGCSERTARITASKWLTKPNIGAAIETHRLRLLQNTDITVERVIREIAAVAFADPRKFYDSDRKLLAIRDLPDDAAHALAGWEEEISDTGGSVRKIKLANKMAALEALMRHLRPFDEDIRRSQLAVKNTSTVEVYKPPPTDEEKLAKAIKIARILQEAGVLPDLAQKATNVTPTVSNSKQNTNGSTH